MLDLAGLLAALGGVQQQQHVYDQSLGVPVEPAPAHRWLDPLVTPPGQGIRWLAGPDSGDQVAFVHLQEPLGMTGLQGLDGEHRRSLDEGVDAAVAAPVTAVLIGRLF